VPATSLGFVLSGVPERSTLLIGLRLIEFCRRKRSRTNDRTLHDSRNENKLPNGELVHVLVLPRRVHFGWTLRSIAFSAGLSLAVDWL
jgi:hypothetical protein